MSTDRRRLLDDPRRCVGLRGPGLLVLEQVVGTLPLSLFVALAATSTRTGGPCNAALADSAGSLSCGTTAAVQTRTTRCAPAGACASLGCATDYATTCRASDPPGTALAGTADASSSPPRRAR